MPRKPVERVEMDYVSCVGDTAHVFGLVAVIFFAIAVATPAWVDTSVKYPGRADAVTFGRGLWQAYEYDHNGLWTLYNYYTEDADGNKQDPICGSASASFFSPFLLSIAVERTRDNESNAWCQKKQAMTAFALVSLFATAACFTISLCLQRGCCSVVIYIVFGVISVISSLIAASIGGAFALEEQNYIDDQPVDQRMYPVDDTEVTIGYSLSLFICGLVMMIIALVLFFCECCQKDDEYDINEA